MVKKGTRRKICAICFDGRRVIYGDDTTAVVMETTTRMEVDRIEIGSFINHMTVTDGGGFLLVGCDDSTGRVVDMKTKKMITLNGHTDFVYCIIECEDTDVLTCSLDKTIRRWNRLTGECTQTYTGHSDWVRSIVYDKKTKRIFSGSDDRKIRVWNAATGAKIGLMKGHRDWVTSLAFVNATTIVSGSRDKTLKIWDITKRKEVKTMSSHAGLVYSVAVTPDGQFAVSGSSDETVKMWSIATGECIATLSHHSRFVYKVAVSPDGRFIASGGSDDVFYLLSVTPPFSCIVCEGLLNPSAADHRLLSDGRLLKGDIALCSITPSTSCTVDTETGFTLKNHQSSSNNSNSNDNSSVSLSAPSASSAQQWIEAICAVRRYLTLHPDKRPYTTQQILTRYRFDLLQTFSILNKRSYHRVIIPKDVMQVIGNYLVRL